jgi:DNA polymerase
LQLFLDIETRSAADLTRCGQYVYAEHPTTEILMVAYAIDDDPVKVWLPREDEISDMLAIALADPTVELVAHNASFERIVMGGPAGRAIGIPDVSGINRWECTAARAAGMCLPRALGSCGAALGLPMEKDQQGHRLMLQMCKPRAPRKGEAEDGVYWFEDPERMQRLATYCARDVEVEREIAKTLPRLSDVERETWRLTERMNDQGVLVDDKLLIHVSMLIEAAEIQLNAKIKDATNGAVPRVSDHMALTRWLVSKGIDEADKTGVGKAVVSTMIENTGLDPLVREVLCMRRDGGGSSAKKWRAILRRLSNDGRLRGALVYCGASATGRWASRGAQLQNLPRGGTVKDIDGAVADVLAGATMEHVERRHGPALVVASELLRPAFMASPGGWLARGDYSQIEARVNPWLAGAQWKLDAFWEFDTGIGPDLYKVAAGMILGIPPEQVDKVQRQSYGKVSELALGFGGGARALQKMATAYGVKIPEWPRDEYGYAVKPEDHPDLQFEGTDEWIKRQWRAANPEIVGLWHGLEAAALECMKRPPGEVVDVWTIHVTRGTYNSAKARTEYERMHKTPLTFRRNSKALAMRLPSGRHLYYWTPQLRLVDTVWGKKWTFHYRAEDAVTKRWSEFAAYGGLLCENAVQAVARDVMRDALLRLYRDGILPVLTVHDEAICEMATETSTWAALKVQSEMLVPPAWAPGLPIAAESSAGSRYVKA